MVRSRAKSLVGIFHKAHSLTITDGLCHRVVVVTGEGRSFCAGADLKALVKSSLQHCNCIYSYYRWNHNQQSNIITEQERISSSVNGFGSISRRRTSVKPIICAVNGGAYGGGVEMILNCDIVVASEDAKFALPEVKRGVVAIQGGMFCI